MATVMGSTSVGSSTVKSSPKSQNNRLEWLAGVTEEAHQLWVIVGSLGQAQGEGVLGKTWKIRFGHIECTRTGLDTEAEKQGWNGSPELRRPFARFEAG